MLESYLSQWLENSPTYEFFENFEVWSNPHSSKPPHSVILYRALDDEDNLLYVGVTDRLMIRMKEHRRSSKWWNDATKILLHGCESREEALALEAISVWVEKAKYNKTRPTRKKYTEDEISQIRFHQKVDKLVEQFRLCAFCGLVLDPETNRKDQKYCNASCKAKFWYREKNKKFYDDRYQKFKKEWEKSPNGKRAGISIREWLKLPKDWR